MGIVKCGVPISSLGAVTEISTPCDVLTPPTACAVLGESNSCQENHTLEIVTTEYAAAIKNSNKWLIPACNQTAQIIVPGLTAAHIGSYIWSANYGSFLITGFVPSTHTLSVRNLCTLGNKTPGTIVPVCSLFIITSIPCSALDNEISYLTVDFIVPSSGNCGTMKVTSTAKLAVGLNISLGTSQFTISEIVDATTLQVCNLGFGGAGGSTLHALNGGGMYQYVLIVTNSSKTFSATRLQNIVSLSAVSPTLQMAISDNSQTINYVNPSNNKAAQVLYTLQAFVDGTTLNANTSNFSYNMELRQNINGAGLIGVIDRTVSKLTPTDADGVFAESNQIMYDGIASIPPGQTFTLDTEIVLTWVGSGGAVFNVDTLKLNVVGLVVIS